MNKSVNFGVVLLARGAGPSRGDEGDLMRKVQDVLLVMLMAALFVAAVFVASVLVGSH